MVKCVCDNFGFVYDPAEGDILKGIGQGTKLIDMPDYWVCPSCGVEKWRFAPED